MDCLVPFLFPSGAGTPISPPASNLFTARYPIFGAVDPTLIASVLGEAANEVTSNWRVADQVPGIMAFAAHLLASEGIGAAPVVIGGESIATSGPVSSYKAGDTEIKFSTAGQVKTVQNGPASSTDLTSTIYGLRFLELQRRNLMPAVLVV